MGDLLVRLSWPSYSGLTAASTGQRPYRSMIVLSLWMDIHLRFRMGDAPTDSRIFQTSTAFLFKTLIGLKTAYAPLAHLKTRADWRDFFKDMQSRHFLFVPCYCRRFCGSVFVIGDLSFVGFRSRISTSISLGTRRDP